MSVSQKIIGDVELVTTSDPHDAAQFMVRSRQDIFKLPAVQQAKFNKAYNAIETICDPEIPVLTIMDLGVFRVLSFNCNGDVSVSITPTYSGCPAMSMIAFDVELALREAGFEQVKITLALSPAWTTDWMTEIGRQKLIEYGIAAPIGKSAELKTGRAALFGITQVECPQCGSVNTEKLAEFGSTACKAQYRCKSCLEPFDYFKCI